MAEAKPLVLDVDGTFLRTDMLYECFWAGLGKDPLGVLRACAIHFRRREVLKRELAGIAKLRVDLLPVNPDVAALADTARSDGRVVVLASASDTSLVEGLARHHDLSPRVFASTTDTNLKGAAKAEALVAAFGEDGFDYAGNEVVDKAIWDRGDHAIVVGSHPTVEQSLISAGKTVTEIPDGWRASDLIRALRPHQWVKNVLLLVPLIAAHEFGLMPWLMVLLGIVSFSMAASSIYIVNDLLDLEADRLHATKHRRPFASGAVPIKFGMAAGLAAGVLAIGLGALLGWTFLASDPALYDAVAGLFAAAETYALGRYRDACQSLYLAGRGGGHGGGCLCLGLPCWSSSSRLSSPLAVSSG